MLRIHDTPGRQGCADMRGGMRDLAGALRAIERHPVGILLPAGGRLLAGVISAMILVAIVRDEGAMQLRADPVGFGGRLGVAWWALRIPQFAVELPFRGLMLAGGATAMGAPHHGPRLGPLLVVTAADALFRAGMGLLVGVPGLAAALFVIGTGWFATGLFLAAVSVLAAELAAVAAGALLAGAPAEVVVGGRGGIAAIGASLVQAPYAWLPRFAFLLVGDAVVAVGSLVCGAGALPGYPIAELAVLHHWLRRFDPARRLEDAHA